MCRNQDKSRSVKIGEPQSFGVTLSGKPISVNVAGNSNLKKLMQTQAKKDHHASTVFYGTLVAVTHDLKSVDGEAEAKSKSEPFSPLISASAP